MKRSEKRILTTHAGSLVRPTAVIQVLRAESFGEPYDEVAFERMLTPAVAEVIRKQIEAGVDVPSDGEFGKVSWANYVVERLGGLERRDGPVAPMASKDRQDFADFYAVYNDVATTIWMPPEVAKKLEGTPPLAYGQWVCTDAITYKGSHSVQRDISNLKSALHQTQVEEAFLPLAAPSSVEATFANEYYPNDEAYLYALADALREDYRAVVDAGLILQVDDAFIPYNYDRLLLRGVSMEEYRKHCELRIAATNYALRGIPEDCVRYHICWGSFAGPHTTDVPLSAIVDLVLKVNAQAYSVEAANPRHAWEWKVWEDVALSKGKILIPGLVTHSTNVVEHPETVAQRIELYARIVGRENIIAGTDCGFSQGWWSARTHPTVQWAKLQSLAEGARLASTRLWGAASAV